MFLLGFFTDLLNQKYLSGIVSEPVAVLFFGITLFAMTAGLRSFLNKKDKRAEKLMSEMKEAVVIEQ